jgi:hypothetical protein
VRRAVDAIRIEYGAVLREQPQLTLWEAFAVAKLRCARDFVAANVAVDLAEAERRYRPAGPGRPAGAR